MTHPMSDRYEYAPALISCQPYRRQADIDRWKRDGWELYSLRENEAVFRRVRA